MNGSWYELPELEMVGFSHRQLIKKGPPEKRKDSQTFPRWPKVRKSVFR
jgi:hypothetical protein